ncbi:GNAT family N-acetyltransferase [Planococcus sp. YIM B11945]|uniref:GNAT family N-acetyltransferase n=1 Tax=Planococcus sp. YIM B11945 TaxID=3435410 RepID=UPI003D7C9953
MGYEFIRMTQNQAEDIAGNWHYEGVFSFYDIEADKEDLADFLDAEKRGDLFFSVLEAGQLAGFFSFDECGNAVDIGLGMRPDLTGRGRGQAFIAAGMRFAEQTFNPEQLTLSVATFNQRAIRLYKKMGFREVAAFQQETNGGHFEFLKMVYACERGGER